MSLGNKEITKWRCQAIGVLAPMVVLAVGCGERTLEDVVDFPARDTPNYQGLVSVHWLNRLIDYGEDASSQKPRPETYLGKHFVIVEASWATLSDAKEYHAGHIPGAVHFNTDELENGRPRWRLREAGDVQHAIGRVGITPDTTVIVYGHQLTAAARVWWAFKYAGVSDVRLLDGGFEAWKSAGYPAETDTTILPSVSFEAPITSNILATTEYVRNRIESTDLWLADVRSEREFTGQVSGYSYLDAKGIIPSAIPVGDGSDDAHIYIHRDGRLRKPEEILELWRKQGIVTNNGERFEREVIFYCGGGWRSSIAFFYAWLLGFENIRNYSDGWSGWSTEYLPDDESKGSTPGWKQIRTTNPVEVGAARR